MPVSHSSPMDLIGQALWAVKPQIEGLARRRGHPSPEDFFQDFVIERLRIAAVACHISSVAKSYFLWLAESRLRDFHRGKGRSVLAQLTENSDPPTPCEASRGSGDVSIVSPEAKAVRSALKKLRPKAREIVQRKLCWDQSPKEIARTLSVNVDAVRSSLQRSRGALRRRLSILVGRRRGNTAANECVNGDVR